MRQVRWASWMVGLAMAFAVSGVRPAVADVTSDRAAAILNWPSIIFAEDAIWHAWRGTINTIVQLSNTSTDPVNVHCFYENANSHCTNTGQVCEAAEECCLPGAGCGICLPGWNETDFHVQITPRQPLGWLASDGVSGFSTFPPKAFGTFAIDGVTNFGIGGSSNAGSRIPPVPEEPFLGALRCIVVDEDGIPIDRNVIKGEGTIEVNAGSGRELHHRRQVQRDRHPGDRGRGQRRQRPGPRRAGRRVQRLPELPHPQPLLRWRRGPGHR